MRHKPYRRWSSPWKRRCRCGADRYPCPDAVTPAAMPSAEAIRKEVAKWNAPTTVLPNTPPRPLLTPGQQWRTRPGRRHRQ